MPDCRDECTDVIGQNTDKAGSSEAHWDLDRICTHIDSLSQLIITTHPSPDGDAIGSVCALGLALLDAGRKPLFFNVDAVPSYLRFIPGADRFVRHIGNGLTDDFPQDLLVLDASDSRVLPDTISAAHFKSVVTIDHHRTVGDLGRIAYRDEAAAATGVLIYRILKRLGLPISKKVASALFVAISSDTGSFRFQNTDAECFAIANELVSLGAKPGVISDHLAPKRSCAELKHIGKMLSSVVMMDSDRIAVLNIDEDALISQNLSKNLGGGVVQLARQIPGVEVAATVRCLATPTDADLRLSSDVSSSSDGIVRRYKVSMRSTGRVDVSRVASGMGGGGHFYAAGATIDADSFSSVHDLIVDLVSLDS